MASLETCLHGEAIPLASSEKPNLVSLPAEALVQILSHLNQHDIVNLVALNSEFYKLGLGRLYRFIHVYSFPATKSGYNRHAFFARLFPRKLPCDIYNESTKNCTFVSEISFDRHLEQMRKDQVIEKIEFEKCSKVWIERLRSQFGSRIKSVSVTGQFSHAEECENSLMLEGYKAKSNIRKHGSANGIIMKGYMSKVLDVSYVSVAMIQFNRAHEFSYLNQLSSLKDLSLGLNALNVPDADLREVAKCRLKLSKLRLYFKDNAYGRVTFDNLAPQSTTFFEISELFETGELEVLCISCLGPPTSEGSAKMKQVFGVQLFEAQYPKLKYFCSASNTLLDYEGLNLERLVKLGICTKTCDTETAFEIAKLAFKNPHLSLAWWATTANVHSLTYFRDVELYSPEYPSSTIATVLPLSLAQRNFVFKDEKSKAKVIEFVPVHSQLPLFAM